MLNRSEPSDRSGAVALLKEFIAEKGYTPGDRLPSERELIKQLEIKRNTLRKALDTLEREGVIWRHVGKGTFIAGQDDTIDLSMMSEIGHQITPVKMMRARQCIEAVVAREAAINASRQAIKKIAEIKERAKQASSWAEYEAQDDLFHYAIAEATDNILLLALFDQLAKVRRAVAVNTVIRESERPPENHNSFTEHDRIFAAIEARDPKAAHDAMWQHVASVSARLFGEV
ncbi:MAG: FadR family transcriptional regulator [Roseibium sp.]|uniref:FadR/GntR family transcriptional regulator n=1 Tax=Roseibium sp. TaxID=1936156 RepID=UPI001B018717|nr:FCD domain-containing protein [Roseibium sp.]MBO6894157.1 FadR family transcriptional regulator [Roseibium sp.]MBO6932015.1 FadR family transcriptional regulator [Roseibium sp.]